MSLYKLKEKQESQEEGRLKTWAGKSVQWEIAAYFYTCAGELLDLCLPYLNLKKC